MLIIVKKVKNIGESMKSKCRVKDAKLSKKGQITVPKEVREKLGVDAGDRIVFFFDEKDDIKITNAENTIIVTKNNRQIGSVE